MAEAVAVPPAVGRVVEQIAERFRPERIILFGSHAAGTADEGSDVDLLVVMATAAPAIKLVTAVYRSLDQDVPVDVLVRTPDQVAARIPRDLIRETILAEGVALYEAGN